MKTDPNKDYGHLPKVTWERMDREALAARQQQQAPSTSLVSQRVTMATDLPTAAMEISTKDSSAIDRSNDKQNLVPGGNIKAITGPVVQEDSLMDINDCENGDIIDLDTSHIASRQNTNEIVDRIITRDIRLGVNLRAQMFIMASCTEDLLNKGKLSVEQLLELIKPKINI